MERCILWPAAGPPMIPGGYNNNYQILQTPGYVVILIEMIHDVRIIPLDGRAHAPSSIRQWMGDSRGRWDGNTLVVTTTNFTDKTNFRGSSENLRLVERFTRVDPGTINYQFTVDDPASFPRPWTAAIPMTKTDGPIFEYACHEGNYGMTNLLSGARAEEQSQNQEDPDANNAHVCPCRCQPAVRRRPRAGASRLCGGVRREEADQAAGNGHESRVDQSPRVDPYRREGRRTARSKSG